MAPVHKAPLSLFKVTSAYDVKCLHIEFPSPKVLVPYIILVLVKSYGQNLHITVFPFPTHKANY